MKAIIRSSVIILVILSFTPVLVHAQDATVKMAYTVSMEQPSSHYYRVEFSYEGITGESVDLKMPVWTPGYYMVLDLAKYVVDFTVTDVSGKPLVWEKTAKNTWHVNTTGVKSMKAAYYVFANRASVAEPYLADNRGFISPTGVFMHVAGKLNYPVTVTVKPYSGWKQVSTGLDPVPGLPNTFTAADFDRLYDCPILVGNQEIVTFEYKGLPHTIAIEKPGACDRQKLAADLKRIVEAATNIIGDIPYKHYTYIIMEKGGGGLEHLNSMAVFADVSNYQGSEKDRGLLGFFAHEYFHLYNIKSIRPVVLGPFDYDRECVTNMLWFSEGGTVYYEELILNRAGFLDKAGFLANAGKNIGSHENGTGHLFQSAALSSRDTWMLFFNRSENGQAVTINYYNKGATLCLLLDLKIRNASKNVNSLDDVMRTLYTVYNKERKRGFTDKEFREACEQAAGCSLAGFFELVYTTADIDYAGYLAYAGLTIDLAPQETVYTHLGKSVNKKSFAIMPMENAGKLEAAVLADWLK
jgi:predicted metalloprotease with PDZ domain